MNRVLRRRKRLGRLERILWPGRGRCYRCGRPWRNGDMAAQAHTTKFTESEGCIPLCEDCWSELSPQERLPFYRQLWDKWNTSGFWIQWADGTWHKWRHPEPWPVIEQAVLAEGEDRIYIGVDFGLREDTTAIVVQSLPAGGVLRPPQPFDVIVIDGVPHAVVEVHYPGGQADLEPLADVLARSIAVGDEVMTLGEAMIVAGWTPGWARRSDNMADAKFGDLRLRDWRECGHHPVFPLRPWACLEKLEGPFDVGEHRLPQDEQTDEGWGTWQSVCILKPEEIERLAESIDQFRREVTS